MIKDLRLIIFSVAVSTILCASARADNTVESLDSMEADAALDLEDGTIDAFYGDGWYRNLGISNSFFCNNPANAGLPMCLTGLIAPVLTWPSFPDFSPGRRRHHHGHHRPIRS